MAATASDERYAVRIRERLGLGYQQAITEMQQRLRPRFVITPTTVKHFLRIARWWELEAMRCYDNHPDEYGMNSSHRSLMYAANQRWLAELLAEGHPVVGMRFDIIVTKYAYMTWDDFVRRHAEKITGCEVPKGHKRTNVR